ncbi:UDP-glucuronosyltransferase 2B33-like [Thrips palmi]|uniref:UDP-glucuronosyltransferase 2B33-like n=1 Tax=Thrips palmi TaxID=161013 RepID=A0A6P8XTC6_THRPL|nr:UDP-glucuronosyltransferase 2B33-like [Thrips palmi]
MGFAEVSALWTLVVAAAAALAGAAEVLVVLPQTSHSHLRCNTAVPRALAERGHNVTLVVPWPPHGDTSMFKSVIVVGDCTDAYGGFLMREYKKRGLFWLENISYLTPGLLQPMSMWFFVWKYGDMMVEHTLQHPAFRREVLDRPDAHYDVVLSELLMQQEAFLGLAHHFDAPLVALQPNANHARVAAHMGGPTNPAYANDRWLQAAGSLDFWQRAKNVLLYLYSQAGLYLYHLPRQRGLLRRFFPDAPSLEELEEARLVLTVYNDHPLLTYPMALPSNVVRAPLAHLQPLPLPQRLQGLLDNATAGAIVFSLGSLMMPSEMPASVQSAFMTAFGELGHSVVARWSDKPPTANVPDNVHLETSWMPQDDLLAHANTLLLVSSCGWTSVQEAMWYGVPVLCMPRFGDQFATLAVVEELGVGLALSKERSLADVRQALQTLLQPDNRYRRAAQRLALLLQDQPVPALDVAVEAVEHVIRWRGAGRYRRPSAARLHWHQLVLLDVVLFLKPSK